MISAALLYLIVGAMVVEGIVLGILFSRKGMGISIKKLLPNLVAGGALMTAIAMALNMGGKSDRMLAIGCCLVVALIAHLFDLRSRWNHPDRSQKS